MSDFTVKVLKTDGTVEDLVLDSDHEGANADLLREAVGGWLQLLTMVHPDTDDVACLYMDEEGKWKDGAQINVLANVLLAYAGVQLMPGDVVVGPCVVTGIRHTGDGAVTAPLSEAWLAKIREA